MDNLLGLLVQRGRDGKKDVYFADILSSLKEGAGNKALRRRFGIRSGRNLQRAREQFAVYSKLSDMNDNSAKPKGLQVLFDENVASWDMLDVGQVFGSVTNVYLESLTSAQDAEVWAYAVERKINVIVTRDKRDKDDRDLTYIAKQAWYEAGKVKAERNLPMLMHVSNDIGTQAEVFGACLEKSLNDVFRICAAKEGPVMQISMAGVQLGVTQKDLEREQEYRRRHREKDFVYVPREEVLARKFMRVMLAGCDRNDERAVKRIKREVTRRVAITREMTKVNERVVKPLGPKGRKAILRLEALAVA